MIMDNIEVSRLAVEYVKQNKKLIIEKFASPDIYKPYPEPATFFMAGSPGAGKTETSKDYILGVEEAINKRLGEGGEFKIVRIDGDDIRVMLPGYSGNNADLFQEAISLGVNKLIDHCFHKRLSMLVDGTFASPNSIANIERTIKHNRLPNIIYVAQDPKLAWEHAKARESKDGRRITAEVFANAYFAARDNIKKVKEIWGDKVNLHYAEKDFETNSIKYKINISSIDGYSNLEYNIDSLKEILK